MKIFGFDPNRALASSDYSQEQTQKGPVCLTPAETLTLHLMKWTALSRSCSERSSSLRPFLFRSADAARAFDLLV